MPANGGRIEFDVFNEKQLRLDVSLLFVQIRHKFKGGPLHQTHP